MPLDARHLVLLNRGAPYDRDVHCGSCGYNLIGLRASQPCPECGSLNLPFGDDAKDYGPAVILRDPGRFFDAPADYRRDLTRALTLAGVVVPAMLAAFAWTLITPHFVPAIAALIFALIWLRTMGPLIEPRRVAKSGLINTRTEWLRSRVVAAATQPLWLSAVIVAILMIAPITPPSWAQRVLDIVAGILGLTALAGTASVMVILSNIAYWAGDSRLAFQARASALFLPIAAAILGLLAAFADPLHVARHPAILTECVSYLFTAGLGLAALLVVVHAASCFVQAIALARWAHAQGDAALTVPAAPTPIARPRLDDETIPLAGDPTPPPHA